MRRSWRSGRGWHSFPSNLASILPKITKSNCGKLLPFSRVGRSRAHLRPLCARRAEIEAAANQAGHAERQRWEDSLASPSLPQQGPPRPPPAQREQFPGRKPQAPTKRGGPRRGGPPVPAQGPPSMDFAPEILPMQQAYASQVARVPQQPPPQGWMPPLSQGPGSVRMPPPSQQLPPGPPPPSGGFGSPSQRGNTLPPLSQQAGMPPGRR